MLLKAIFHVDIKMKQEIRFEGQTASLKIDCVLNLVLEILLLL